MHQPRLVGAIQGRRNLFDHRDRIDRAEPAPVCGHVGAQIAALDQPHVDIKSTVDLTEAVDGHHVRIVEARRRACLAAEAFLKVAVLGQMRGEQLEGDYPVGGGVVGAEDLPHAATTQHAQQLVSPE